jgi:hypothetical protein
MRGVTRADDPLRDVYQVCACGATGHLDFYQLHGPADAVDAVIEPMQPRITFVGRKTGPMEQGGMIVIIRTREGRTLRTSMASTHDLRRVDTVPEHWSGHICGQDGEAVHALERWEPRPVSGR